jgi:hypothetical protein
MKAPATVTAVLLALPSISLPQEAPRPLERIEPAPAGESESLKAGLRDFDEASWVARLSTADLEARERSFGAVVRRAAADPAARGFLERSAADGTRPELAWTARLALRELEHNGSPFPWMQDGPDLEQSLRRMLEEARRGLAPQPGGPPFDLRNLRILPLVPSVGASVQGRNVQVQQSAEGAKVVITETIDGKENKREYQGKDLQQILADHPELAAELHLSVVGGPDGFRLQWQEEPSWSGQGIQDPFASPSRKSEALRTDVLGVVVSAVSAPRAQELGISSGLLVHSVNRGTIASLLQVRSGDVLLEVNGRTLARAQDITEALALRSADGALTVVWIDGLGQRVERTWRPEGSK